MLIFHYWSTSILKNIVLAPSNLYSNFRCLSLSLSISLSLFLSIPHLLCILTAGWFKQYFLSLCVRPFYTFSLSLFLSPYLSLSLSHTHSCTHSHTHTLSLSLSACRNFQQFFSKQLYNSLWFNLISTLQVTQFWDHSRICILYYLSLCYVF